MTDFNSKTEECRICNTIFTDIKPYRKNLCRGCYNERCKRNVNSYKNSVGTYLTYLRKVAQKRAAKKNLYFDIDDSFLINRYNEINGKCEVMNIPLVIGDGAARFDSISIDRIDSTKGYSKDNVQIVCWGYNRMKGDLDEQTFFFAVEKIYEYMKNKDSL